MKHVILIFCLFLFSNGFCQDKIPVKHDSCVHLRFNKALLFRKNKVGIYDTGSKRFVQKYEKGTAKVYHGNAEFDAIIWDSKSGSRIFFYQDTISEISEMNFSLTDRLLVPSHKNAFALADTAHQNIIMFFYDPFKKEVQAAIGKEYLHMAITYPVAQKDQVFGNNSTIRTNNFYSYNECFSYAFGEFTDCQVPIGQISYDGEIKTTPFHNVMCEYFSVSFKNNVIIVNDYGPFPYSYNDKQNSAWANSRIYELDNQNWIAPEDCIYITKNDFGNYIYKSNKRGKPYYIIDSETYEVSRSNPQKVKPGFDLDPNFILGGPWDAVEYLPINDRRQNFKTYYQCRKGNKYAIVELQNNMNNYVQYPISPLADIATVSQTHSLIVSINNDTLYLNFQGNTDQAYPLKPEGASYFFPYFSSVKESYEFIDLDEEKPSSFMLAEPYLHVIKENDYLIINLPFTINKTLPKTMVAQNKTVTETVHYETEESAAFVFEDGRFVRVGNYVSQVTLYPFGYLYKSGSYISKTDEEGGRPKVNNEYPYGQFSPTYKFYNKNGIEIKAHSKNEFSQVLDLGFGFQVYISGKSFFMNYEGKIITEPIFHEFYLEDENLIGVVYEDQKAKEKKIALKKVFTQY